VKNDSLNLPLLSSCLIHLLILLIGSAIVQRQQLHRRDFLPIGLIDVPRTQTPPVARKVEAPPTITKPLPPSTKVEIPNKIKPAVKNEIAKLERLTPAPAIRDDSMKAAEAKPAAPAKVEPAPSFPSGGLVEGGGNAAGAGNLFGRGDVGVVPGPGTAGGGGGTAASGLGRGSGAPGLPAQTTPLRTNREAKPLQTVRATYPAMALRAGLESDVTLKIEVDSLGIVNKAEIVKSGGAGFDEEALKAVKQSRFEPAQREGQNVPAEFTFVYRFRLQR